MRMILPNDFYTQMKDMLGDDFAAFEAAYSQPHFSALRYNSRKIDLEALCAVLKISKEQALTAQVTWEPCGLYYTDVADGAASDGDLAHSDGAASDDALSLTHPGKSPYHEAGLYYIQEPSAMLPVTMLDVDDSGMKVLDLCAAPGGKTTQIADRMNGAGLLIANEIIPSRAKILSENIERMGVSNAVVISADPKDICERFASFFDRILVDAPCSGEGMFRKHPEAMDEWSLENVDICAERQAWILDCAAEMLAPGGRMVFSTCTFNNKEDEGSIDNFLLRHPDFEKSGECHRIFPHTHNGEGHFSCALIKKSNIPFIKNAPTEKPSKKEAYAPFIDFANEALTESGRARLLGNIIEGKNKKEELPFDDLLSSRIFICFGDQLYLAPAITPPLKGLKVLRPGLHLGTMLKGRFEPSHALALYLRGNECRRSCDFGEADIQRYLHGEALTGNSENGWCLVTVSGFSTGWGKVTNNVVKNHYPKGLRTNY